VADLSGDLARSFIRLDELAVDPVDLRAELRQARFLAPSAPESVGEVE
jgi:hypothetical protein